MTDLVRWFLPVVFCSAGLSAAQTMNDEQRSGILREIHFVSEEPDVIRKGLPDPLLHCVENEWTLPQPWQVGTSPYNVALKNAGAVPAMKTVFGVQPVLTRETRTVLVLVVDDFSNNPDIPGANGRALSHGEMVMAHMRSMLDTAGFEYSASLSDDNHITLENKEAGQSKIVLQKVDLNEESFTAPGVPARLISAEKTGVKLKIMSDRLMSVYKADHLVINMSFVVLPCWIDADYRISREKKVDKEKYSLSDYLKDLEHLNNKNYASIVKVFSTLSDNHALVQGIRYALNVPGKRGRSVAVAASGNYGLNYSLAPASRPEVLGVGGVPQAAITQTDFRDVNSSHPKLNWSNAADVYSMGEWFALNHDLLIKFCSTRTCLAEPAILNSSNIEISYSGTSFASPSVASYLAARIKINPCFVNESNRFKFYDTANYIKILKNLPGQNKGPVFKGGVGGYLNPKC